MAHTHLPRDQTSDAVFLSSKLQLQASTSSRPALPAGLGPAGFRIGPFFTSGTNAKRRPNIQARTQKYGVFFLR